MDAFAMWPDRYHHIGSQGFPVEGADIPGDGSVSRDIRCEDMRPSGCCEPLLVHMGYCLCCVAASICGKSRKASGEGQWRERGAGKEEREARGREDPAAAPHGERRRKTKAAPCMGTNGMTHSALDFRKTHQVADEAAWGRRQCSPLCTCPGVAVAVDTRREYMFHDSCAPCAASHAQSNIR